MKHAIKLMLAAALVLAAGPVANAQLLRELQRKAERAAQQRVDQATTRAVDNAFNGASNAANNAVNNAANNSRQAPETATRTVPGNAGSVATGRADFYVSAENGSNRADGKTPQTALKNLQKAIDLAENGQTIYIAEGNYLGTLDVGYIEVKNKYISLIGGFSGDFSRRDPFKYISYIQPTAENVSTNGSKACLELMVEGNERGTIVVDGLHFDRGEENLYAAPNADERNGWPEGCLTGRIQAVGEGLGANGTVGGRTLGKPCMQGNVQGNLIVRNCVFCNGGYYGLQMMNKGGRWTISNNVFVANSYAGCQVDSMTKEGDRCYVDFTNNTVLFTWCRTKLMEDMGYGFRFMSRVNCNVRDCIFGCSNYGAMDYTHKDSNKDVERMRRVEVTGNRFFMNRGDLVIPSASYMWLFVRADQFEDVNEEDLDVVRDNKELTDQNFLKAISEPYLKGFAQIKVISEQNYNPNSAANLFREAHGMNKMGTETVRVSMYGNRYPFFETFKLFGAMPGKGAQAFSQATYETVPVIN